MMKQNQFGCMQEYHTIALATQCEQLTSLLVSLDLVEIQCTHSVFSAQIQLHHSQI